MVELASPTAGTLTRIMLDFTGVTSDLAGLYDDQGKPPVQAVRIEGLGKACYMSNRTGWADAATACTTIRLGNRPANELCYDQNDQRTSCPTAYLGDSPLVPIFQNLRNNDQGLLRVQVAATGQWYTLGVTEWPCAGPAACTETREYFREYGGFRPATGEIACINGVPMARVSFGTDALVGFRPGVKPGEAGNARFSSNAVGWTDASTVSGPIGRDARGDYFFEMTGLPAKESDGTFVIYNSRANEWTWMDPTAFAWNASVVVNPATYHLAYDVGTCP